MLGSLHEVKNICGFKNIVQTFVKSGFALLDNSKGRLLEHIKHQCNLSQSFLGRMLSKCLSLGITFDSQNKEEKSPWFCFEN